MTRTQAARATLPRATGYPRRVNRAAVLVLAIAACKGGDTGPAMAWVDLAPLPLQIKLPEGARAAPLEALAPGTMPAMQVFARECIVVVAPSTAMDAGAFEASIRAAKPDAEIGRVRGSEAGGAQLLVDYTSKGTRSFRLHATIGDASWTCEPF